MSHLLSSSGKFATLKKSLFLVVMARDAGARKVYFASAAPPVKYPNVYGIDMPTSAELIACDRDVSEVQRLIGADALIYQDNEDHPWST